MASLTAGKNMFLTIITILCIYIFYAVAVRVTLASQALAKGVGMVANGASFITMWAMVAWLGETLWSASRWLSVFAPLFKSLFVAENALPDLTATASPLQAIFASSLEYKFIGGLAATVMSAITCGRR